MNPCKDCRYYQVRSWNKDGYGTCSLKPPTVLAQQFVVKWRTGPNPSNGHGWTTAWPVVKGVDPGCGEWKVKP